jgi:hypothetical protein
MTRKRKFGKSLEKEPKTETESVVSNKKNPFLSPLSPSESSPHDDDSLHLSRVVAFSQSPDAPNAVHLVESLENDTTGRLRPIEITNLLLTWCIAQFHRKDGMEEKELFVWRALRACLKVEGVSLSQSTLFKLVPKVAMATLVSKNHESPNAEDQVVVEVYRFLLGLFRPVLDVAYKSVLFPILLDGKTHRSCPKTICKITMEWIQSLSMSGNPKTTFQLLANEQTLGALARANSILSPNDNGIVLTILSNGLFHYKRHMDGFASRLLQKSSTENTSSPTTEANEGKFQSYQSELMKNLKSCLDQATTKVTDCKIHIIQMLPLLLRGFLQQSHQWNLERRAKHKEDSLTRLQFAFIRQLLQPLVLCLMTEAAKSYQHRHVVEILISVGEMLQLVWEYDVYVPTPQNDSEQFPFWKSLVDAALSLKSYKEPLPELVEILCFILRLNHLLLHEKMDNVILIALKGSKNSPNSSAISFLLIMNDTYKRLRQQNFIISSWLKTIDKLSEETLSLQYVRFLNDALDNPTLASDMAISIESCPVLEIRDVFTIMADWWISQTNTFLKDGIENSKVEYLAVPLRLCTLVMENVRVDRGTAVDASQMCQDFMDRAVTKLSEVEKKSDSLFGAAISLCGSILDLQIRCSFWLGSGERLALPPKIAKTLDTIRKESVSSKVCRKHGDALTFLGGCHLRSLHSTIHDATRREMCDPQREKLSAILADEAARFSAFLANSSKEKPSRWIVVAKNINVWLPYASDNDVWLFLEWVFDSFRLLDDPSASPVSANEAVAKMLLNDYCFLRHTTISSKLGYAGLSSAANTLRGLLQSSSSDCFQLLCTDTNQENSMRTMVKFELLTLISKTSKLQPVLNEDSTTELKTILSVISLINGLPSLSTSEWDAVRCIDLAIRMDHVCRSLFFAQHEIFILLAITGSLRLFIAKLVRLLPQSIHTTVISFLGLEKNIEAFLSSTMSSALDLCETCTDVNSDDVQKLRYGTGALVETSLLILSPLKPSSSDSLKTFFQIFIRNSISNAEKLGMSFIRNILDGLRFCEWNDMYGDDDGETSQLVRENLASIIESICTIPTLQKALLSQEDAAESDYKLTESIEEIFILGDLIRVDEISWIPVLDALRKNTQRYWLYLANVSSEDGPHTIWDAICYLVGSLAYANPLFEIGDHILDMLFSDSKSIGKNHEVLDSAFCHVLPRIDSIALGRLLQRLILQRQSGNDSGIWLTQLRLWRHALRCLERDDHVTVVASFGKELFHFSLKALDYLRVGGSAYYSHVSIGSSLLECLLKNRDILILSERELALLMSYMSGVLGPSSKKYQNCIYEDKTNIAFLAMSNLFLTLFHRYTKSLYACVPSVISVLHSFLCKVIYAPNTLSDATLQERGRYFTRLCALLAPNKEIYKKHVIGLVLEFVQALENSVDLVRRECVVPAIYFLLDTMSDFETKQLNALMDTRGKVLFRTVYQSYQKFHAYKGH